MSKKGEHIIDEYNLLIVLHILNEATKSRPLIP